MAGIVGIEVTVTIHDAVLPAIDHAPGPLLLAALRRLARAKRLVNVGQDGCEVVHLLGAMHHQLL